MTQLNMPIPDDLDAAVKAWGDRYGISKAAAVRVLLNMALKAEQGDSEQP